MSNRIRTLAPLLAVALFLCLAIVLFGSGGNDDSHITYWSAWTLATQGEILNYNGAALEQSSSLTLVLLLGLLHALTRVALPTLGWAISLGAGAAAVGWLASRRPAAGLVASASLPLLYWSTSGMESSLLALLLLAVVALSARFLEAPARRTRLPLLAVLAAAIACRPETPILLLCAFAALAAIELLARSPGRRPALELFAWTLGFTLLLVLLRLALFGEPLPHPALAKAGGFDVSRGARYLRGIAEHLGWLLPAAAAAGLVVLAVDLLRRRRPAPAHLLAGAAAFAGVAFCVISGGDWMPAGRFVVPVIPLLALLAALAIERLPWWPLRAAIACAIVAAGLWATFRFAPTGSNAGRPHLRLAENEAALEAIWGPLPFVPAEYANRAHLRDAGLIPPLLDVVADLEPTAERPLTIAAGQAGMVPYHLFQRFFGRLRFYDAFGLTDDALVRCLPERNLRRSIWGTGPGEAFLVAHPEALARCGLPPVDVLFSVSRRRSHREAVLKAGYRIVYSQSGSLRSEHALFPGGGSATAFIAVREAIADRVRLPIDRLAFPLEGRRIPAPPATSRRLERAAPAAAR